MIEVYDSEIRRLLKMAVNNTPIHFLGVDFQAKLKGVYHTGVTDLYRVSIEYGPYSLNGLVSLIDPDMLVFLDYTSVMLIIQVCIENALTEYDANSSPHYRGM